MAEVNRKYLTLIRDMIHHDDTWEKIYPVLRSYKYQGGCKQMLEQMLREIAQDQLTSNQSHVLDQITSQASGLWLAA